MPRNLPSCLQGLSRRFNKEFFFVHGFALFLAENKVAASRLKGQTNGFCFSAERFLKQSSKDAGFTLKVGVIKCEEQTRKSDCFLNSY
jgi:hypothetical protein